MDIIVIGCVLYVITLSCLIYKTIVCKNLKKEFLHTQHLQQVLQETIEIRDKEIHKMSLRLEDYTERLQTVTNMRIYILELENTVKHLQEENT